jgi:hypothetical protein
MRRVLLSDSSYQDFEHNVRVFDVLAGKDTTKDVKAFYDRHLKTWKEHNARGVWTFGTTDNDVVFYTGCKGHSYINLDEVWAAVEAKLGVLEADSVTEATFSDYRKILTIAVNDFNDETQGQFTESLTDESDPENPVIVKKRKHHVTWRELQDAVESDINDKVKVVRIDQIREHVHQEIKQTKVLP